MPIAFVRASFRAAAVVAIGGAVGTATPVLADDILVRDQAQFRSAMASARPGDDIILANGEWRDFRMQVKAQGTASRPVTVRAQQPGRVHLTGRSNLQLSGRHIVVSGLTFRDGYSPTSEVIAFRTSGGEFAYDSRVTQTVIDRFNKPRRDDKDLWVVMYGRGNRFDHNHVAGKTNVGATMTVRLHDAKSHQNRHRIDHNYFGPRPLLGQNGAETLRIGTSQFAHVASRTLVENNVFDRTDGELEVVSVKSAGNVVRGNVFLQAKGTLTLRHGDGNLVERNVFFGDGKAGTGGIRIINRDQVVRDNYMEGLAGDGLSSALSVMNGMPNSPAHKHAQVRNARIERNSVVASRSVTLGAGANRERSAAPTGSLLQDNLFAGRGELVRLESDPRGIARRGNVLVGGASSPLDMERSGARLTRASNGLLYPADPALARVGAPRDLRPVSLDEVGVRWYRKPARR